MSQLIGGEEYLDVDEAIAFLGIKKTTLYTYVSRGVLRSYRQQIGRGRLYRRNDVIALLSIRPPTDTLTANDDRVLRDVSLPDAASWAGEH